VPQIIITHKAVEGLERCRSFLAAKSSEAATRASQTIQRQLMMLTRFPNIGRQPGKGPERELVIPFGRSSYLALYRHEPADDVVYILAIRHGREASY
jgi:plasmid stabilization system protein ParE